MNEILGEYDPDLPVSQEGLTIVFSPTSISLKQRWRNNGLSADFMADYFSTFFIGDNSVNRSDIKIEVKSAVSFIANELLENAMKFNDDSSTVPISIRLQMNKNRLIFLATNSLNEEKKSKLINFIQTLTNSDPNDMYIEQLEKNAMDDTEGGSGLGLLTMINDYQAKLGWKFEYLVQKSDEISITTMVQLIV
ncbi:MAG TPA: DUF6272 family protein [Allocoleopsis sp.]